MKISSSKPYFVGIDPGRKGAFCLLAVDESEMHFLDMPKSVKGFREIYHTLKDLTIYDIYIEDVHSLPGMSAKSNFTFGGWVYLAFLVAYLLNRTPIPLPPKLWQQTINLKFPPKTPSKARKEHSYAYATELVCDTKLEEFSLFTGKKGGLLDGRVDAFLIAYAGLIITGDKLIRETWPTEKTPET